MNKIYTLKRIFKSLKKTENINGLIYVSFFVLIGILFELIGVGLVPAIVVTILNPLIIENILQNYLGISFLNREDIINYLIALFGFTYLLKTLISIYIERLKWSYVVKIKKKYAQLIYEYYINSNYNFYVESNSAVLIRNVNTEVVQFCFNFIIPFIVLVSESITLIFILILLLFFQFKITFYVIVGFSIAYLLFHFFTKKTLEKDGRQRQTYESIVLNHLQSSFHSVKEIKTFGLETFFTKNFFNKNSKLNDVTGRFLFINSLPRLWFEFIFIIALIFVLIIITSNSDDFIAINAILGLYLAAILRIMPSVNRMATAANQMRFSYPAIDKVIDLVSKEFERDKSGNNLTSINTFEKIEYKNIYYKFPKNNDYFIEDFNFRINKNDKIAIIGETGSGKSTIVNILIGLVEQNNGDIYFDNHRYSLNKKFFNLIGYVPQNVYLFDETIKKNVTLGSGDENIDNAKYKKVMSISLCEKFVGELPVGDDTVVGEKAIKISGGQAQRLGIARALYKNPKLLVLDEGTSALDLNTENQILDNLFEANKDLTTIYITHRKENLHRFNRIIEVKNGKIFEN